MATPMSKTSTRYANAKWDRIDFRCMDLRIALPQCRLPADRTMARVGAMSERIWRSAIGIIVSYAVAFQSLVGGGFLPPSISDEGLSGFELCINGGAAGPALPPDAPRHHGDNHCTLCVVGAYQPLAVPPDSPHQRAEIKSSIVWWPAASWLLPQARRYLIARPRGPPLSA
jgi:hypothetical protein